MKSLYKFILVIALAALTTACFNKRRPNYQYFPDMYTSPSYETYGEYEIFPEGQSAMLPAEGTIPLGWEEYEYPNTFNGKLDATENLKNPLPFTEENVKVGKELYDIYCAICHGGKGDGKGALATREKIMGIPGFDDPNRNMTEGDIYHVIYYGLNNMGSYAVQTTTKERWQITHYVTQLQDELNGRAKRGYVKEAEGYNQYFDREVTPALGKQMMKK